MHEIKPMMKAVLLAQLLVSSIALPIAYIDGGIPAVLSGLEMVALIFLVFFNLFLLFNRLVRGDLAKSFALCSIAMLGIILYVRFRYSGREYLESANIRLFYISALGLLIVLNILLLFISRKKAKLSPPIDKQD